MPLVRELPRVGELRDLRLERALGVVPLAAAQVPVGATAHSGESEVDTLGKYSAATTLAASPDPVWPEVEAVLKETRCKV